jgi:hypothetical protein
VDRNQGLKRVYGTAEAMPLSKTGFFSHAIMDNVNSSKYEPGFEQVYTVTDYYDGPLAGIADYRGNPHFYDRIWDAAQQEYSDLFQLSSISRSTFDCAMEDWAIWQRWELAFHTGHATIESHPALPEDRARHEELKVILSSVLKTDSSSCIIRKGLFEAIKGPELPKGVMRPMRVKWTDPD